MYEIQHFCVSKKFHLPFLGTFKVGLLLWACSPTMAVTNGLQEESEGKYVRERYRLHRLKFACNRSSYFKLPARWCTRPLPLMKFGGYTLHSTYIHWSYCRIILRIVSRWNLQSEILRRIHSSHRLPIYLENNSHTLLTRLRKVLSPTSRRT